MQRLDEEFGLGAVTVTTMGQDAEGFLWIGTQTGLYRYDGARARKMTEVEPTTGHYIMDMVIAPDGTPGSPGTTESLTTGTVSLRHWRFLGRRCRSQPAKSWR